MLGGRAHYIPCQEMSLRSRLFPPRCQGPIGAFKSQSPHLHNLQIDSPSFPQANFHVGHPICDSRDNKNHELNFSKHNDRLTRTTRTLIKKRVFLRCHIHHCCFFCSSVLYSCPRRVQHRMLQTYTPTTIKADQDLCHPR